MCTLLFDLFSENSKKKTPIFRKCIKDVPINNYIPIRRSNEHTNVLLKSWNHLSKYWNQLIIFDRQKWKAILLEAFSRMQNSGCHRIPEFVAFLLVSPEHKVWPASSVVLQFKIKQKIIYLHSRLWQFEIHTIMKKV